MLLAFARSSGLAMGNDSDSGGKGARAGRHGAGVAVGGILTAGPRPDVPCGEDDSGVAFGEGNRVLISASTSVKRSPDHNLGSSISCFTPTTRLCGYSPTTCARVRSAQKSWKGSLVAKRIIYQLWVEKP